VLDNWCQEIGRDPAEIERVGATSSKDFDQLDEMVRAGAQHFIIGWDAPWDITAVRRLVEWRDAQ
jgi:hypothetical protein